MYCVCLLHTSCDNNLNIPLDYTHPSFPLSTSSPMPSYFLPIFLTHLRKITHNPLRWFIPSASYKRSQGQSVGQLQHADSPPIQQEETV